MLPVCSAAVIVRVGAQVWRIEVAGWTVCTMWFCLAACRARRCRAALAEDTGNVSRLCAKNEGRYAGVGALREQVCWRRQAILKQRMKQSVWNRPDAASLKQAIRTVSRLAVSLKQAIRTVNRRVETSNARSEFEMSAVGVNRRQSNRCRCVQKRVT